MSLSRALLDSRSRLWRARIRRVLPARKVVMANLDADDRNADWLKISAREKAERARPAQADLADPYPGWLAAWWECARYEGSSLADVDDRVALLLELWTQPIGNDWCRQLDQQLLRSRDRRSDVARAKREHAIEAEVLAEPLSGLSSSGMQP
jgi:hypothetical protein